MNGYMFLNPEMARSIRRGRIQQLEEEHYGALLLREENDKDDSAAKMIAELERRIKHHVQALNTEMPVPQPLPEAADEEDAK